MSFADEQLGIDKADAATHQLVLLDQYQNFSRGGYAGRRQALEQLEQAAAITQVAAGEFTDHPGMDEHITRLQRCCELRDA